jgi:hypothetical protein
MTVGISIVFMQMHVNNRNLGSQQINEFQIVVPGCLAQIGVPEIQAHSHMGLGLRGESPKPFEKAVKILRESQRSVLHGEHDAVSAQHAGQRNDTPDIGIQPLVCAQMYVEEGGPDIVSELYGFRKALSMVRVGQIDVKRGVDGTPNIVFDACISNTDAGL